jgi:imidazolonepropionase-like amidohydrolase
MEIALRNRLSLRWMVPLLTALLTVSGGALWSADLRPGYHPAVYAIQGARIMAAPGSVIDSGTVVVRDGLIEAVGPDAKVAVPSDAEVIGGKGLIVYPGFVDLYTNLGQPAGAVRSQTGSGRAINYADHALASTPPDNRFGLTPEFEVARVIDLADSLADERRKLGFTALVTAPDGAIATGQSALISLSGLPRREALVRSPVALHINLRAPSEPAPPAHDDGPPRRGARRADLRYPNSLMGIVAHLRQAMLDAEHAQATVAFDRGKGIRPAFDPALGALAAARSKAIPVWWEANSRDEILRALDLAAEFGTTAVIVGGRDAAKVADRLKALDVPVVLRLDFPDEPKTPTQAEYAKRSLADREEPLAVLDDRATKWKERVATAKALAKAGVRFAFSSDGIAKADSFHSQLRKAIAAGLPADKAVDALTRQAAAIAGVGGRLGTIEPGKLGHLTVLTAPYGDENAKVRYLLVDGLKFEVDKSKPNAKTDGEKRPKKDEPKPEPPKESKEKSAVAKAKSSSSKSEEKAEEKPKATPRTTTAKASSTATKAEDEPKPAAFVDIETELEPDRVPRIKTGGSVLIKDAVILTVTKGTIPKGSILIEKGVIREVGETVSAPKDVTVIDAAGMVAMPGIIDTHSHIAIQGGVNEMSLSIVPEVRVKDTVRGDDPDIYRALAGGTTTARLLHGSANTIGGQDAVIKLRQGQPGHDLIIKNAPQGVKFALGENVTRVNGRFPNTRMGVEATIERAFEEAQAYKALWKNYEAEKAREPGRKTAPPRRDLRLEALAGVLDGTIKIHCHCYRSDEILMLLQVAARHGVRVQSLQHVLEGYKVAPEIAAHGASASTFSDWWAYKIEAYDAIPYNAALLTKAGVHVCIKSDSQELMRHLYLEAAKMMKYGDLTEEQALATITINPARELGLDDRLGSIEKGKDGDIALFNAHPFDGFARCELALIDGEVWFQRRGTEKGLKPRRGDHATAPAPSPKGRGVTILNNPKAVYALMGATVHPVSGKEIPYGTVVISEGRISAVGGPETRIPGSAQTIDVQGYDIWPGLVDAGTPLGLYEIGSLNETQDFADSAQFQPELHASIALHPDTAWIPVTRANGVLTAYVQPRGGVIAGQGCAIDLNGWVPRELIVADSVALHVNIPAYIPPPTESPRGRGGNSGDARQKRKERIEDLKEEFHRALVYEKVLNGVKEKGGAAPAPDPRLAALIPYASGKKPVIFHAEHRMEILDALQIAEELKLKAIISGGADAWKVADALKKADVPVLLAGTLRMPSENTDPYDAPYTNAARLSKAGVKYAIRSKESHPEQATASRNLPYEAAVAVAYGLDEAEALRAVTLAPAEILGIADQVGSIEVGKRANLVITAGHILQPTTKVKALFLDGKPLTTESRHTRLYDRYLQRLSEVESGASPLGLEPRPNAIAAPGSAPAAPASPAPAPAAPAPGTAGQH